MILYRQCVTYILHKSCTIPIILFCNTMHSGRIFFVLLTTYYYPPSPGLESTFKQDVCIYKHSEIHYYVCVKKTQDVDKKSGVYLNPCFTVLNLEGCVSSFIQSKFQVPLYENRLPFFFYLFAFFF